jgi:hypothetical protein
MHNLWYCKKCENALLYREEMQVDLMLEKPGCFFFIGILLSVLISGVPIDIFFWLGKSESAHMFS